MDGFINLKKERGMTSFQCVAAVRRICGVKKVGHAGTLDPEAEGVLPVCIGNAAKCSEYFLRMPKSYRAELTFGFCTDTMDIWGAEIGRCADDLSYVNEALIQSALPAFTGEILQKTPMYSAVKKDGVPLYKLARKGIEAEIPPRSVHVYNITLESFHAAGEGTLPKAVISVTCSRGTYIRSICDELGRKLGCYAVMSALTRTSYGKMRIENAVSLDELSKAVAEGRTETAVLPVSFLLDDFPHVKLQGWEVKRYIEGKTVIVDADRIVCGDETAGLQGEEICVYAGDRLFAIARSGKIVPGQDAEAFRIEENAVRLLPHKFFGLVES